MKSKKQRIVRKANTSVSNIPQFESFDLYELESRKRQAIEDRYKPDNTPFENKVYDSLVVSIEEHQLQYSMHHYALNGTLPDGIKEVVIQTLDEEIHNEGSLGLGIEGWDELLIKIGLREVVFQNILTHKSIVRPLKSELNWHKNLKIEVLRIFSSSTMVKSGHFRHNGKQSIKNAITELRKDLCTLFPDLPDNPIEYDRKGKGWLSPIQITMQQDDAYMVETSQRLESGLTYEQELNQETHMGYATYDSYDSVDEE